MLNNARIVLAFAIIASCWWFSVGVSLVIFAIAVGMFTVHFELDLPNLFSSNIIQNISNHSLALGLIVSSLVLITHNFTPLRTLVTRITGKTYVTEKLSNSHPMAAYVSKMSKALNITPPSLYTTESPSFNAFALSGSGQRAAIVISTGLIRRLAPPEVRFVLMHELAHIYYQDTISSTYWVSGVKSLMVFQRAQQCLASFLLRLLHNQPLLISLPLTLVVGPLLSILSLIAFVSKHLINCFVVIDRLISRKMEIRADTFAAKYEGKHTGASVLIQLSGNIDSFPGLFSTHPSTEERIKNLSRLDPGQSILR